ncbi:NHLP leader peptide family natural product precursor [bacterium]|nr:NHLP leader peptide family natural product precursor [bacterium]
MTIADTYRDELESRIIEQVQRDPAFRHRLLDDPKAAVSDFLGIALPLGMTITVLEEEPGHHILVLPPTLPDLDALPLDDLELSLIGGGRTLRPIPTVCSDTRARRNVTTDRSSC